MDDLIRRQDAIKAVEDEWENAVSLEYERDIIINDTTDALEELPSAVIYCKDCIHYIDDYCRRFGDDFGLDFYCGFGDDGKEG